MSRSTLFTTALAFAATAVAAVALATGASAHSYNSKRLDNTASNIEGRYQAGRKSGAITYREGRQVRRTLSSYRSLERAYKADGRLTAAERRMLRNKLSQSKRVLNSAARNDHRRAHLLPRVGR